MITQRDEQLLADLEAVRHVYVRSVVGLYYPSYKVASRRLYGLLKAKCIKRHPSGNNREFIYYSTSGRPCQQPEHLEARVRLWKGLKETGTLSQFEAEHTEKWRGGTFRCDAFFALDLGSSERLYMYEYERTTNILDKVRMYERYASSGGWERHGVMPRILVETTNPKKAIEACKGSELRWEIYEDGQVDYSALCARS